VAGKEEMPNQSLNFDRWAFATSQVLAAFFFQEYFNQVCGAEVGGLITGELAPALGGKWK
jgi:hypothetical protein